MKESLADLEPPVQLLRDVSSSPIEDHLLEPLARLPLVVLCIERLMDIERQHLNERTASQVLLKKRFFTLEKITFGSKEQ